MTTQHTPGPWTLESGRTFKTERGEFYVSYYHDKQGYSLFRPTNGWAELDANCQLMAAAPELLAALQDCVEALDEFDEDERWPGLDNIQREAQAAITKATNSQHL